MRKTLHGKNTLHKINQSVFSNAGNISIYKNMKNCVVNQFNHDIDDIIHVPDTMYNITAGKIFQSKPRLNHRCTKH